MIAGFLAELLHFKSIPNNLAAKSVSTHCLDIVLALHTYTNTPFKLTYLFLSLLGGLS